MKNKRIKRDFRILIINWFANFMKGRPQRVAPTVHCRGRSPCLPGKQLRCKPLLFQYIFITLTGFVLVLLFFTGCGSEEQPVKKMKAASAPGSVDVNMIECKGTVEALRHFKRYLGEGEKVTAAAVTEGSPVKKGDHLITLSNDAALKEYTELSYRKLQYNDKKNNIKILELEIAKISKEIADLEKELEQEKKIGKDIEDYPLEMQAAGIKKEMDRLKEELNILEKKRDFLKASVLEEGKIISFLDSRLSEVNNRVKGMDIRAPFAGVVVYVPSSIESLRPGDLVVEVLDNTKLYVKANVWQHQLQYIKPGDEVEVYPDFFGDYFFKGKVKRIRPSHTKGAVDEYPKFPVFIDIEPGVKELKVGMSVTVKIRLKVKMTTMKIAELGTPDAAEQASLFPTGPNRRPVYVGGWHRLPLMRMPLHFSSSPGVARIMRD